MGTVYRFFSVLPLLFFLANLYADEGRTLTQVRSADGRIQAELSVLPREPQLSDTITLTLKIQSDSALHCELPEFGTAFGDLKINNISKKESVPDGGKETRVLLLTAVPQHKGKTPILPIPIRYFDKQEKKNVLVLTLPPTELMIQSNVSPENASLDNIPSSIQLLETPPSRWYYLAALLLVLTLVFVSLLLYLRRRKNSLLAETILSPQEIAMQKLAALLETRLYETDVKRFYIELTGIVRWCIEQQTAIHAPELTTEEFLREIASPQKHKELLSEEVQHRLRLFLESSDMVKFAKFQPQQEDIMQGFHRAEEFVGHFAPQPKF